MVSSARLLRKLRKRTRSAGSPSELTCRFGTGTGRTAEAPVAGHGGEGDVLDIGPGSLVRRPGTDSLWTWRKVRPASSLVAIRCNTPEVLLLGTRRAARAMRDTDVTPHRGIRCSHYSV